MRGEGMVHPAVDAWAQAQSVCLQGNALPARWAGRRHFVVLETGFGLGDNFLATWDAWRRDPQRCEQLHFVAVEPRPPSRAELAAAQVQSPGAELASQLMQAWPPLTPGLHALDFEGGRVQLLLAVGEATVLLPTLRLAADALCLGEPPADAKPPAWPPRLLKAVGRLAAPESSLATASVAEPMRAGLLTAGFQLTNSTGTGTNTSQDLTVARFAPRFVPPRLPAAAVPAARHAVVVGAGLAGAAMAQALARQGLQVTVLEQHGSPAQEGSGNLGGLFHGTLNADDGVYARLFRAAALQAARAYAPAIDAGAVPGQATGLLRLETTLTDLGAMQAVLQGLGLPAAYVSALGREQASQCAGVPLPGPAWFYPGGGWVSPAAWVRHALATTGVQLVLGAPVQGLLRSGQDWCVQGAHGQTLARAPILVLANAAGVAPLLAPLGHSPWPLQRARGQVTSGPVRSGPAGQASSLKMPVAGDGYALPLSHDEILCGATRQLGDEDSTVREADHRLNLERLQRLTGLALTADSTAWQGRTGWRLQADDRLPIAGAMPVACMPEGQRMDQGRLLPREPGLFVLTALGARGLSLAPLLARLVAAQATGTPWPVEQALADAVDPARWRVRAARQQPG